MSRWKFLFHNVVIHPLCGVLWASGVTSLAELADRLHEGTGEPL